MHSAQHRSKPQTQRPLLKVLFLSLSSVPTPGMVSGTWGRAATGCWVARLTSVYALLPLFTAWVRELAGTPRLCFLCFLGLWVQPVPLPGWGKSRPHSPAVEQLPPAPAPKAWLTQPLLAPSFILQIIFASFSLENSLDQDSRPRYSAEIPGTWSCIMAGSSPRKKSRGTPPVSQTPCEVVIIPFCSWLCLCL